MKKELEKKVSSAIKLLQSVAKRSDEAIEVAYSGGKDSDVVLELARMSGINYRAIYRNTTIDPPLTIKHVKDNGVEILRPKKSFFQLVEEVGFPNRYMRFCCRYLKEYKVLDKCIMGVRKAESVKRAQRYSEPTECRFYGSKKEHVEAIYPILDWTDEDVVEFLEERGVRVHPLYYREDGTIDPKRRLGCMCCPLASHSIRLAYFKRYPRMVRAYLRAGKRFLDTHGDSKTAQRYEDVYEWFVRDVFFDKQSEYEEFKGGMFGEPDYRGLLEGYFGIPL